MNDPLATFAPFIERVRDAHPNFAYVHVIKEGTSGTNVSDESDSHSDDVLRKIWGNRPYIAAGGFNRASANRTVEKYGGLVAFGRHFIANVSALFVLILEMVLRCTPIA